MLPNLQGGYKFTMKAEELRKHPGLPFLAKLCCCDYYRDNYEGEDVEVVIERRLLKELDDGKGEKRWWCPQHGLMPAEEVSV